jgi:tetratricopeptide (TPR) repeat protein
MAGFGEKLSAIKGKQEAADLKKKQEAEQAAEAARLEREAKRSELSAERDTVMAEFAQAEQTANEAREAIAQADAFAAEQGENLDPEAKAEIDAMKVEAGEAQQKFEELKTKLDALNVEISAFEGTEESQEIPTETTAEVIRGEESATEETPQVEIPPTAVAQEQAVEEIESQNETTGELSPEATDPAELEKFSEKSKEYFIRTAKEFEKTNLYDAAINYRAAGNEEKFQELTRQCAAKREAEGDFEGASFMYKDVGDQGKYEEMMNKSAEKKAVPGTFGGGFSRAAEDYERAGNLEKAKEMHLRAARQHEQYENSAFYAAQEYEKAGDEKNAKKSYERTIKELEANPPAGRGHLEQIAESYSKLGNQEKAKEAYLKFAEVAYQEHDLKRAAEVYAMLGDEKKAQELAEEEARNYIGLVERAPFGTPHGAYEDIAEIYKRAGNEEMANRYTNFAIQDKASRNNHQASIAESQGEFLRAAQYYDAAGNKTKAREAAEKTVAKLEQVKEPSRYQLRDTAYAYEMLGKAA